MYEKREKDSFKAFWWLGAKPEAEPEAEPETELEAEPEAESKTEIEVETDKKEKNSTQKENNNNELSISNIDRHDLMEKKEEFNKSLKDIEGDYSIHIAKKLIVTRKTLNTAISDIQDNFEAVYDINNKLINEMKQFYVIIDALDNEYITAILDSITAIKTVNDKTLDNQKDIQDSIENQKKTIKVLQKFKQDIDKLKHITDVDKAWELIKEQNADIIVLKQHADELSQILHIKDVDDMWNDTQNNSAEIGKTQSELQTLSKTVNNFQASCKASFESIQADFVNQAGVMDSIHNDCLRNISKTNQALNEQGNQINQQKTYFSKRLKIAYAIGGTAAAFSIVQFILILAGVL